MKIHWVMAMRCDNTLERFHVIGIIISSLSSCIPWETQLHSAHPPPPSFEAKEKWHRPSYYRKPAACFFSIYNRTDTPFCSDAHPASEVGLYMIVVRNYL